jgi:hypothetical protein
MLECIDDELRTPSRCNFSSMRKSFPGYRSGPLRILQNPASPAETHTICTQEITRLTPGDFFMPA